MNVDERVRNGTYKKELKTSELLILEKGRR